MDSLFGISPHQSEKNSSPSLMSGMSSITHTRRVIYDSDGVLKFGKCYDRLRKCRLIAVAQTSVLEIQAEGEEDMTVGKKGLGDEPWFGPSPVLRNVSVTDDTFEIVLHINRFEHPALHPI